MEVNLMLAETLAPQPSQNPDFEQAPDTVRAYASRGDVVVPRGLPCQFAPLISAYAAAMDAMSAAGAAHNAAELAEDGEAEARTEGPWLAAQEAAGDALRNLLAWPSADVAVVDFKRSLLQDPSGLLDWSNELDLILDSLVDAQAGVVSAPGTAALWNRRRSDYELARLRHRCAQEAATADSTDELHRALPSNLRQCSLHYAPRCRWSDADALRQDILLSAEHKATIRPALEAFWAARDAASHDRSRPAEEEAEALYDAVLAAEAALLRVPVPSIDALLYKQDLIARETDDDKLGFADLGWVAFREHSFMTDQAVIVQYRDLLRLAGRDHPVLHMDDFAPRGWIKAYEALGGAVSYQDRRLIIAIPEEDPHGMLASMRRELDTTPWKYRAVQLAAESRMDHGSDPFVDSLGRAGCDDRRGTFWQRKARPTLPVPAALCVTFYLADGAPAPNVEHVDNRKAAR